MSSNTYLIDRLTREQLLIQRYSNSVIRELLPILTNLRNSLEVRMMQTPTEFQAVRLAGLQADLSRIITEITGQLEAELTPRLTDLAQYQAEFAAKALQTAVTVETVLPSVDQIAAVVTRTQMRLVSGDQVKNMTLNQLISEFAGGMDRQIKAAIQAGVIEGRTVQEMAREVSNLVGTRSRRQAETLVRTAVNHVGSVARQRTYEANADVIAGEEYTATLDGRTRPAHAALDGKVFPIGQGPQTPNGYNCRCVRVPKVKDEFKIPGIEGERASVQGPVSSKKNFDSWLRDQDESFQREYFSKFPDAEERFRLFKEGGLKLDHFVDADGAVYSMAELRAREPMAMDILSRNPPIEPSERKFLSESSPVNTYKKPRNIGDELVSIPVENDSFSMVSPPKPPVKARSSKQPARGQIKYTAEEQGVIEYYKGDGFYQMNRVLREPENYNPSQLAAEAQRARAIDSVIEKSKTTRDHSFYRGVRSQDLYQNAESMVGRTISNVTPQSTSFDESVAQRYAGLVGGYSAEPSGSVVFKVNARKGSSALNMQSLTDINADEREILLKANSDYVVRSVQTVQDPSGNDAYKVIEVDYVER